MQITQNHHLTLIANIYNQIYGDQLIFCDWKNKCACNQSRQPA